MIEIKMKFEMPIDWQPDLPTEALEEADEYGYNFLMTIDLSEESDTWSLLGEFWSNEGLEAEYTLGSFAYRNMTWHAGELLAGYIKYHYPSIATKFEQTESGEHGKFKLLEAVIRG